MIVSVHAPIGKLFSGRTFASLHEHYNYRLYFSGQFLSQIGTWLQSAAMAWLVLELTHSAFAVGIMTFWQFGPYLVLGLFGGVLSDRLDHRKTLIVTQVALALCSGTIALLTFLHIVTVWEAYAIAAIRGLVLMRFARMTPCFISFWRPYCIEAEVLPPLVHVALILHADLLRNVN